MDEVNLIEVFYYNCKQVVGRLNSDGQEIHMNMLMYTVIVRNYRK